MDAAQLAKEGLGWAVSVMLAGVVVYQNRRIEKLYDEKDALQERRRADGEAIIDKYNSAMGESSQTIKLLLARLPGER